MGRKRYNMKTKLDYDMLIVPLGFNLSDIYRYELKSLVMKIRENQP